MSYEFEPQVIRIFYLGSYSFPTVKFKHLRIYGFISRTPVKTVLCFQMYIIRNFGKNNKNKKKNPDNNKKQYD